MSDLWRYPFLPDARKAVQGLELETLLDDPLYGEARALGLIRLETAVRDGRIVLETPADALAERDHLHGFLVSRLLLAVAGDTSLTGLVAVAEGERTQRFLHREPGAELVRLARQLRVATARANGGYTVHFTDYLRAAGGLREGKWKLVNRPLRDGRVRLSRRTLERLMREAVAQHLLALPKPPEGVAERFEAEIEALLQVVQQRRERAVREMGSFDYGKAPPCFAKHLADLQGGVNLPHPARFFLTTFLTALGREPEQIMELYATAPDFRESVTRYQVEHITGKISGTEYDTPGCDTLISQGVCPGGNALCREIPHPLSYYRAMAEREKPDAVRRKRMRLAKGGGEAEFWTRLPLLFSGDAPQRSLAASLRADAPSRVAVRVDHFRAHREKRGDEFVISALARLADDTVAAPLLTLPLTQWELALPLANARGTDTPLVVTLLPVKLSGTTRLHVLAVG